MVKRNCKGVGGKIINWLCYRLDSPRLRFAGRPSLQLRWKEGRDIWILVVFISNFATPLSAEGEERVSSAAMTGESPAASLRNAIPAHQPRNTLLQPSQEGNRTYPSHNFYMVFLIPLLRGGAMDRVVAGCVLRQPPHTNQSTDIVT